MLKHMDIVIFLVLNMAAVQIIMCVRDEFNVLRMCGILLVIYKFMFLQLLKLLLKSS